MLKRIILRDRKTDGWLLFEAPLEVLTATKPGELPGVFEALNDILDRGEGFAAGFISYEAAPAFDAALPAHPPGVLPLACFGVFGTPARLAELPEAEAAARAIPEWTLTSDRPAYETAIAEIKRQIELGNTYQVNFTVRLENREGTDAWSLFRRISADAPHAAWVDLEDFAIVSASPELFFELDGRRIVCRPMKGTAKRGMTTVEDRRVAAELAASAKNRAENVMITDMIRNDLGRIAAPGSVIVDALYSLEKYPTVWQMTSTVSARTEASIGTVMQALFPCASVTGAPKASSMAIIAKLEESPREIYTGTIGYVGPGRQASFNVAIRTALVDRQRRLATYGVGGGIVWDSDPGDEYDECLLKASVLAGRETPAGFELLETLLWTRENGFFLLDYHLSRMRESAEYFDFPFPEAELRSALENVPAEGTAGRRRVRLLLGRGGEVSIECAALAAQANDPPPVIGIAPQAIDHRDPFLYHKTTHRDVYERALHGRSGVDDVLLWNSDGYITETTIANVVVPLGNRLCTPPVEHGLLAGTLRRHLLERGEIEECPVHIDDLAGMDEIRLINSVRGAYTGRLRLGARSG